MIRCFDSDNIQNVNPNVDPIRDLEIIETEMMLADLESIQKRLDKKNKKNMDKDQLKILEIALDCINNNKNLKILNEQFNNKVLNQSGLLSIKPKIYVCNVDEKSAQAGNAYVEQVKSVVASEKAEVLVLAVAIEADINELDDFEERQMFLEDLGLKEAGSSKLIRAAYKLLDLQTYFTAGAKEVRAWTIKIGILKINKSIEFKKNAP